jgi:hypothetical protein
MTCCSADDVRSHAAATVVCSPPPSQCRQSHSISLLFDKNEKICVTQLLAALQVRQLDDASCFHNLCANLACRGAKECMRASTTSLWWPVLR